jgi:hypothetical protein
MNTDEDQLTAKRKSTARVVCLIAALFIVVPCLGLHWLRAPHGVDMGMSLFGLELCGVPDDTGGDGDRDEQTCTSMSNFTIAAMMRKPPQTRFEEADSRLGRQLAWWMREAKEANGAFAWAGIATLVVSLIGGLSLAAAGALAFKDRFVRRPVALTSVALLALCLALVAACVFVGAKPQGLPLGVSWPFFLYAAGVVVGIAGAQMLSKAFSQVSDPYWDGLTPEPPGPPAPPPFEL